MLGFGLNTLDFIRQDPVKFGFNAPATPIGQAGLGGVGNTSPSIARPTQIVDNQQMMIPQGGVSGSIANPVNQMDSMQQGTDIGGVLSAIGKMGGGAGAGGMQVPNLQVQKPMPFQGQTPQVSYLPQNQGNQKILSVLQQLIGGGA